MGLRERKVQRTRERIAEVALDLFERQGYEATTMEQIAAAADVAPTTLYRYYPTKDRTLVEGMIPRFGEVAAGVLARPPEEPIEVALGAALMARLEHADAEAEQLLRLRACIDEVPAARARVLDAWFRETADLERAIAQRCGTSADQIWVQLSARDCMTVLQLALDAMRTRTGVGAVDHARAVLRAMEDPPTVHPSLPSP